MTDNTTRTALVTGATSGLGDEAAAQLGDAGYGTVIITGRTTERAEAAAAQLEARTGSQVFSALAVDFNVPATVDAAAAELARRGVGIDFLLLNAGMVPGNDLVVTDSGVEVTFASSLIGHHRFTMQLLDAALLASDAHIVIAGSEAARGDVPAMDYVDVPVLAAEHYDGDRKAAAAALIRGQAPVKYKAMDNYATAKMFVAWWSAALARRLPSGMTVDAVSPGSAPDTLAVRNANFFMRNLMVPALKHAPKRFGLAATTSDAAGRYLQAAEFRPDVTGEFFASAPKKMTGPIEPMTQPHLQDRDSQEAGWEATVEVAGIGMPATA